MKEIARADKSNTETYVEAASTFNKATVVLLQEVEMEEEIKDQLICRVVSIFLL
ncbi:hypothetical protein [Bacillus sp. SM2101]|uniref:hypothetical protein n=1 Tax=Bacillus sp. SM2101 TaxID=2805366 RepID=UPI001BDED202|nr:hypothetical protein [Bacillus sp. SM2101]